MWWTMMFEQRKSKGRKERQRLQQRPTAGSRGQQNGESSYGSWGYSVSFKPLVIVKVCEMSPLHLFLQIFQPQTSFLREGHVTSSTSFSPGFRTQTFKTIPPASLPGIIPGIIPFTLSSEHTQKPPLPSLGTPHLSLLLTPHPHGAAVHPSPWLHCSKTLGPLTSAAMGKPYRLQWPR